MRVVHDGVGDAVHEGPFEPPCPSLPPRPDPRRSPPQGYVEQSSQSIASLAAQLQAQPSVLSLVSVSSFSLIVAPTSKIHAVTVIDNEWCRAGH
jgi:hypothetical protein